MTLMAALSHLFDDNPATWNGAAMRLLPFLLLVFMAFPAAAEPLKVTLLLSSGQDEISYTLTEEDSREFRSKWNRLPASTDMIPLAPDNRYHGLVLRDSEQDFRLYGGTGRSGERNKGDEFRMLERWVLERAPPPLGPGLVAALDSEVGEMSGHVPATLRPVKTPDQVITDCRLRAHGNHTLRLRCLREDMDKRLDPETHANALETLLRQPPPAP